MFGLFFLFIPSSVPATPFHAGPLFDDFDLTLTPGHRAEAIGPLFYEQARSEEHILAIPPLLSLTRDASIGLKEYDFLYPVLTYDRYGDQYRWQLCQLLSFAGGPTQSATNRDRFTLFPLYFQQRACDPAENYTALFPFYGHIKHRLFRDEIFFVMFPCYSETRKRDVVTDNYLYPFVHVRHGNGLSGWQFWPFVGNEHKDVTTSTNSFNDVRMIGGHDKFFLFWPFFFNEKTSLGTENAKWEQSSFPAYSIVRSRQRDATTALLFFGRVDDRERKYREWDLPWPLIVFASGEGKTTTRVWPFYSHAKGSLKQGGTLVSDFLLWPIYKYNHAQLNPLDRERSRILFFLYSDLREKNVETGAARRRVDFWPFFTQQRDFNGNSRLQVMALLEPFLHGSHKIERDYSPLWSLWRSERNPKTGASSQSLLWNLYRRDAAPTHKQVSFLFGLYQHESGLQGKQTRLFHIPLGKPANRVADTVTR